MYYIRQNREVFLGPSYSKLTKKGGFPQENPLFKTKTSAYWSGIRRLALTHHIFSGRPLLSLNDIELDRIAFG